jgi:hypothetical protein
MTAPDSNGFCPDGEHEWLYEAYIGGWPAGCRCKHCPARAPEPFCRQPDKCHAAGRCLSDPVCND